jgi:hypothetical protein
MRQEINKGVILMDDGTCSAYEGRDIFTRLGAKDKILSRLTVYLADGTTRNLLGYEDWKGQGALIWRLLGNGFWNGVPILSEPTGQYEFKELKEEVRQRMKRYMISAGIWKEFLAVWKTSKTFDDLVDLILRPPVTMPADE